MKPIFHKIAAMLCAVASLCTFTACESLDTAPEDYFSSGNFWKDATQAKGYMYGLNYYLRSTYSTQFFMGEMRGGALGDGDDGTGVSVYGEALSNQDYIKQNLTADKAYFTNWNGLYTQVMQINHALDNIESATYLTDSQKALYKAQAYGMRAYYYFLLYRTWGGVPLVLDVQILNGKITAERLYKARATAAEIMAQIKTDIDASETYYNATSETVNPGVYQWGKHATLMLKADIYTWAAKVSTGNYTATGTADLQTARTALLEIVNSGKYSLRSNFADLFNPLLKSSDTEMILALPYNTTDKVYQPLAANLLAQQAFFANCYDINGNKFTLNDSVFGTRIYINGIVRYMYKESFWRTFDEADTRRDATFLNVYASANGTKTGSDFGLLLRKYAGRYDSSEGTHYLDTDGTIYRYAEVLLLLAEVENALGNATATYINQIRERAYGSNYPVYTEGTQAENELAILAERDKEFVFEGKRWFDVLRMRDASGRALVFSSDANYPFIAGTTITPILDYTTEAYKVLWPIATATLTIDPELTQTDGY